MFEENQEKRETNGMKSLSARDFLAIGFRQRRVIVNTFLGILSLSVLAAFLLPKKYQAEMKILVRHERAETMVSPDQQTPSQWPTEVSEAELQTEAELIRSRDLLGKVVVACDLQDRGGFFRNRQGESSDKKIASAILKLDNDLTVQPIKLTNLISVSYKSSDPKLAAKVLNSLASLYLEKHLAMHRDPGQFEFFHQQAEQYRKALASTEEKLTSFNQQVGVVDPTLQEDIGVKKLAELEAEASGSQATIAETRQRISTLESQLATLPNRQTTQVRKSDNPQLMQNMKSTLLELELKRTDLLSKFEPTYRPVQEVEKQIAQTQAAIAAAEQAPLRDETTDLDPTYESLRAELVKAKTDLAATEAGAVATNSLIRSYQNRNQQMGRLQMLQQDIERTAKADEQNYMLYLGKAEEARISDALDRQRFSNVVVAEPAAVPFKPQARWALVMALGTFFASFASVALGFIADRWDPSFRTPEEVEAFLGSPVVAAFPKNGD
jgi:uncharacterized protein involved in exopolysaccharide biosynthesis